MSDINRVLTCCCLLVLALHAQIGASAHSARARARISDDVEPPIVKTNSGPVRGYQKVVLGKSLDHFLGVIQSSNVQLKIRFKIRIW